MSTEEIIEILPYLIIGCGIISGFLVYLMEKHGANLFDKLLAREPNYDAYKNEVKYISARTGMSKVDTLKKEDFRNETK